MAQSAARKSHNLKVESSSLSAPSFRWCGCPSKAFVQKCPFEAGIAQSVERQALNLTVAGSSPVAGAFCHATVKTPTAPVVG